MTPSDNDEMFERLVYSQIPIHIAGREAELIAKSIIKAIRPYLTPCADVAGLVEKLDEYKYMLCGREHTGKTLCIYHDTVNDCISITKQHFEVKP